VEPARNLAARAVRQIIDRFCQGSVEELVSGMVEAKVLSKVIWTDWKNSSATGTRRQINGPSILRMCRPAALLVAGTALVLYTMRVKAARQNIGMASVVLLMLVLPIWTAWGPKAPLRLLPPLGQTSANEVIIPTGTLSTAFVPSPLLSTRQAVLLGVYLLGLCLLLLRLIIALSGHADWFATRCYKMACVLTPYARRQ